MIMSSVRREWEAQYRVFGVKAEYPFFCLLPLKIPAIFYGEYSQIIEKNTHKAGPYGKKRKQMANGTRSFYADLHK